MMVITAREIFQRNVHLRKYNPEKDVKFVSRSWFLSGVNNNLYAKVLSKPALKKFKADLSESIRKLLSCGETLCLVSNEDEDNIHSFMCASVSEYHTVVHYCYTTLPWRNLGAAKVLLNAFGITEKTPAEATQWSWLATRAFKAYKLRYNPYLIEAYVKCQPYNSTKHVSLGSHALPTL